MENNLTESVIPRKILMTADTVGGVWTYAIELIRALAKFKIQVELATMGAPLSKDQWKEINALENCNVHESKFKLEWMDDPWEEVEKAGVWLQQLNDQLAPDLIHLNNYCHGNINWHAPTLAVCHSCVLSWYKAVKNINAPFKYIPYAQKVKKGLQGVDAVVAPSVAMMNVAEEYYGPFQNKKVIYNGRARESFRSGKKKEQIFSMGRLWDEAKNIKALVEISGDLKWPVLIAGDSVEPGKEASIDLENTYYLGRIHQQKVEKVLSETSIYVMPAKYEPFGLSVLEAALSGCALVLGDIPSLREIWGDAAIYINPDKPEDLKSKLECLMLDSELREELAVRAFAKATTFSVNRMASEYVSIYSKMLVSKEAIV
jgi:glycosyltransferase involved in cell wall biosynthesis